MTTHTIDEHNRLLAADDGASPPLRRYGWGDHHLQMLYFTSSSVTADGRGVFGIGERDGQPNICRVDLASGEVTQLTHHDDGILKSYVYFTGQPYRGFGKASTCLDTQRQRVYYLHGRTLRVVDAQGDNRAIADYPDDQMTGFMHVSEDGRFVCVPTVDADALNDQVVAPHPDRHARIEQNMRAKGLRSCLRVYDVQTGEQVLAEPVADAWVTHVQFHPQDPGRILYNHEWAVQDRGIRRMWLWDGSRHVRLRTAENGRSIEDWACHEVWDTDGRHVIYHGGHRDGPALIGRVLPGHEPVEIPLPEGWSAYGHFTARDSSCLVTDGYFKQPDEPTPKRGEWLALLHVDWDARQIAWQPLRRHGSSWTSQDAHPHPIFGPDGSVFYTTDESGLRQIVRIDLTASSDK